MIYYEEENNMKFWQRFNKNTFRGIAAALVVAAAVMGGTGTALAAGEPVTEEQTKIISASLLQAGGAVFPIGNDNCSLPHSASCH